MRAFLFILLLLLAADPDRARQANQAYEQGDYARAEEGYRDAIRENPDDPRLHFNLGNALAQQGKIDEALESFQRFRNMAETPRERSMADYNIGNLHSLQQDWNMAVDQYRSSLRQNPEDPDAVHNFEWALRQMMEQQEQPEQEQQQQDGEGQQQQQQGQQDERQQGDEPQDDTAQQEQQQQEGDPEQDGQTQQQQRQPQPVDMTPEEAEQLLNAITSREKDLIRDFLKDQADSTVPHERDW